MKKLLDYTNTPHCSEINGDNLKNKRCEGNLNLRNKNKEYLKEKN
jgi:hypothetical protein